MSKSDGVWTLVLRGLVCLAAAAAVLGKRYDVAAFVVGAYVLIALGAYALRERERRRTTLRGSVA